MFSTKSNDHEEEAFDALTSFDVACVKPNDLFLVVGDDNELADSVIAAICQRLQSDITFVNVFTSLDIDALSYEAYIPQSCIHKNSESSMLQRFLLQQKEMIQRCLNVPANGATRQAIQKTCHTLLILDRCPLKWLTADVLKKSVEMADYLQLTIVIRTAESVSKIPSIITTKTDFCFILSASVGGEHNKLYNTMGGLAPQIKDFKKILQANIQAHNHCMVVDRRKRSYIYQKQRGQVKEDDLSIMVPWMQAFARYSVAGRTHSKKRQLRLGCSMLWSQDHQNQATAQTHLVKQPDSNVFVGNVPTLLDVLRNYGHCAEDERIQITVEIVKKQPDPATHQITPEGSHITQWINNIEPGIIAD